MKKLDELMKELPLELQREVEDFAKFLVENQVKAKQAKLQLNWAGALAEFRERFTCLELQKKALEWWGD